MISIDFLNADDNAFVEAAKASGEPMTYVFEEGAAYDVYQEAEVFDDDVDTL